MEDPDDKYFQNDELMDEMFASVDLDRSFKLEQLEGGLYCHCWFQSASLLSTFTKLCIMVKTTYKAGFSIVDITLCSDGKCPYRCR